MTTQNRLPLRQIETEVEEALRCYPGIARARVLRDADGKLVARVLPWGTHSVTADTGVLAELAVMNMAETRFLHDEIFVDEVYLRGGIVLREDAVVFDVGPNIGIMSCRHDYINWDNEVDLIKRYVANERRNGPPGREEHLAEVEGLAAKDFEFVETQC